MTTTDTTNLAEILSAKKAELNGQPTDVIEADVVTGEIMPAAAVEDSPTSPPVAPAPVEVRYPERPPKVVGGLPYIRDYIKLANTIHSTEMVPKPLQGAPDKIVAVMMAGYELGMGPMQSLNSFDMIQGRPALKPEAMRALVMAAGHLFVLSEGTGYAEVTLKRKDWPEDMRTTYRYDLDDAKLAQLLGKDNWKKQPRAMLAARATGGAARAYFADVIAGMSYTPEEIRDFSGPDQEVTPSPTTPPPTGGSSTAPPETVPSSESPSSPSTTPSPAPTGSTVETPKRPRGRPRKAQSAPKDAPGRSAPPTTPQAPPAPALLVVDTPELTSLNSPGEIGVTREMLKSLTEIIKSLPTAQQPLCRSFIRQHFPEGTADLTPADVQKCIDIAAGWPDSMVQHPAPESDDAF